MSHTEKIQQLLSHKPGLKAQQIANELGLDRSQVATTLHTLLGGALVQDNAYRWWPKARGDLASNAVAPVPRTFLANLCRYYLECLARESGSAISIPADAAGVDYVVLTELPFASQGGGVSGTDRAVRKIVQKVRRERGQLALYIGYAVRVRSVRTKDQQETRLEPVLLYPIEDTADDPGERLRPTSGIPLFNLEVLKNLPAVDSGNII